MNKYSLRWVQLQPQAPSFPWGELLEGGVTLAIVGAAAWFVVTSVFPPG